MNAAKSSLKSKPEATQIDIKNENVGDVIDGFQDNEFSKDIDKNNVKKTEFKLEQQVSDESANK